MDKDKIVDELVVLLFLMISVFGFLAFAARKSEESIPAFFRPINFIIEVLHIDVSGSPYYPLIVACIVYGIAIWIGMKVYDNIKKRKNAEKDPSSTIQE